MRRYCPFCDKYTDWSLYMNVELCGVWRTGIYHDVVVRNGKYIGFDYATTDILRSSFYQRSYGAMLQEANAGTFDPAMWAPTFPALTKEIIEKIQHD